jgi:hypothetical protein
MDPPITRDVACRLLRDDRLATLSLLDRLAPRAFSRRGLGGGDWSPKDLVGHLESWEEHALAALDAWARNEPAPSDVAGRAGGIDALNADEVVRKATRSPAAVRRSAERTHRRLLDAIESLSDERWNAPPTTRARRPLWRALGGILGGPAGPFRHDVAHHADLEAFVTEHAR